MTMSKFKGCYSKRPNICSVNLKQLLEGTGGDLKPTIEPWCRSDTYLKSYPCSCCITSGAILIKISKTKQKKKELQLQVTESVPILMTLPNKNHTSPQPWETYQHGVPTKVFLERCLSPVSNMQAATPKSANLTAPSESIKIFPACREHILK